MDLGLILKQRRQVFSHLDLQVNILSLGQRPDHVALGLDNPIDLEFRWAEVHLARFHLRQVQNIVDHLQQHAARFLNVPRVAFLLVAQTVDADQHFGESDNAVQGRTQFVAHVRQEIALEPIHLIEPHVELSELIDLGVQVVVDLAEFDLRVGQVPQHAVEGRGKFFELVVRVDFRAKLGLAAANVVAHVAQMLERSDNDVANDHVQRDHGREHGQNGDRDQDGPRAVDRILRFLVGHDHLHHMQRLARHRGSALGGGNRPGLLRRLVASPATRLPIDRLEIVVLVQRR